MLLSTERPVITPEEHVGTYSTVSYHSNDYQGDLIFVESKSVQDAEIPALQMMW